MLKNKEIYISVNRSIRLNSIIEENFCEHLSEIYVLL